jgi:glycosyltransferase involved in cell wall biosynthesis
VTTRPARILYVHHRPELGGSPTSLAALIQALDRSHFDPHVFCPSGPSAELFRSVGATVHLGAVSGFTHIWASVYRGRRWLMLVRELLHLPRHVKAFRECLASGEFDLVHLNDSPLIAAAWLAHRAHVPVVWHLRSALPKDGTGVRAGLVRRAIRRFATASIAINSNVASIFAVGSEVVPNTADLERFHPGDAAEARSGLGLEADRPVVSYFGFVYPSKGFEDFIRAAALLRARGIRPRYLVVGGGVRSTEFYGTYFGRTLRRLGLLRDFEADARRLVEELDLTADFNLLPYTPDTPELYRASDVIVAPSRGPELGRPVLEAAASGRPIVASGSIDGAGIVLPDETGFIIPRRSPDVLAAALELLIASPELRARLGARARAHAEEQFAPDKNAAIVMGIYERILARAA